MARLGVPPHVTILTPFIEVTHLDEQVHATLARLARAAPAFDVAFRRVRRWAPSDAGAGVVWLAPEPGEPFVALTRAIWSAYPESPPYGDPDAEREPHLTIAIDDPARFDAAEARARRPLPFTRRANRVELLVEGEGGVWRSERTYALG